MRANHSVNWIVLVELGLVALLIGLGAAIYLVPAADGVLVPRWWHGLLLAALFFLLVVLDAWRRRNRRHVALHRVLRDARREA